MDPCTVRARLNPLVGDKIMKLLNAAICLLSVGILAGCVDDPGYRSGGYYSTAVQYRSYDRDRYYRDYDRRYRDDRRYREDRRDWRDRNNSQVHRNYPRHLPP